MYLATWRRLDPGTVALSKRTVTGVCWGSTQRNRKAPKQRYRDHLSPVRMHALWLRSLVGSTKQDSTDSLGMPWYEISFGLTRRRLPMWLMDKPRLLRMGSFTDIAARDWPYVLRVSSDTLCDDLLGLHTRKSPSMKKYQRRHHSYAQSPSGTSNMCGIPEPTPGAVCSVLASTKNHTPNVTHSTGP